MAVRKLTLGSLLFSVVSFSNLHASDYCTGDGFGAGNCVAPNIGPAILSDSFETRFFGGIQWSFGNNAPELIIGVRRTETRTDETVVGGKLDIAIPISGPKKFDPTFRVLGLAGNRTAQGEAGIGVQLMTLDPLFSIGANVPNVNVGINAYWTQGLVPYAGITTLGRVAPPIKKNGELTCSVGSLFLLTGSYSVPADDIVNGYTCVSVE